MECNKLLYDQYKYEKEAVKDEIQFDMIKRIEDYRRNVNLFNSFGLTRSNNSIPSHTNFSIKWSQCYFIYVIYTSTLRTIIP